MIDHVVARLGRLEVERRDPSPILREINKACERNDTEESEFEKDLEKEADVAELTSGGLKVY